MTLLEYVQTLSSDISLSEKIALTKAWKNKNDQSAQKIVDGIAEKAVEEVKPSKFNEDGSLNVDSFSKETKGAAEKVNEKKKNAAAQDNALATPVMSEKFNFGDGESLFQESEFLKSFKKQQEQKKAYDDQQTKLSNVVSKNETYNANTYDFKWNVGEDNNLEYYQKKEGTDKWKKETNNLSIASIQVELGHASEDQEKALKLYKKQLRKQEKRNAEITKLNSKLKDDTLVPSVIPMDEPITEGDDPNIWIKKADGEIVIDNNPYVGPYRAGYKPVPLEVQIEKYDKIIKNDFEFDKEGKPIIYTEEEANFFNSLIKTRNSLASDYQYQQIIDNSPSNAEIIEMQNLRKDDGTLKNVSEEAFYVESFTASNGQKGGGFYIQGEQQKIPKANQQQAFNNYKIRTGKDAKSVMELTAEDYTLSAAQDPFNTVLAITNKNKENAKRLEFAPRLGKSFEAGLTRIGGKVLGIPSWVNQQIATIAFDDKTLAAVNALPYEQRAKVINKMASKFGLPSGDIANYLLDISEKMYDEVDNINSTMRTFDQTITEGAFQRDFVSQMTRLSTDALSSATSLIEVSIPIIGIPLLIVGEASSASRDKQKEGDDLSLALSGYSLMIGLSEGALEIVTRGLAKKAFGFKPKNLDDSFKGIANYFGDIGKAFGMEGGSETGTFVLNELAEYLYTGKEIDFNKKFAEGFDTFLIGGAFGAKLSSVGAGRSYLNQSATNRRVNTILDDSGVDAMYTAFSDINVSDTSVKLASVNGSLSLLNTQLKAEVNNGSITQGEADVIKQNFLDVQSNANALNTAGVNLKSQAPLTALLIEKNKLQQKIKDINDSDITEGNGDQTRLNEIKTEIQELVIQDTVIDIESSKTREGARLIAEQLGAEFENYGTQESYDARVKELADKGAKVQKSLGYGQAVEFGGETIILINDRVAAERNKYTTDQHELLHPFFKQTFQNNPELAITFGKSLITEILNNKQIEGGDKMRARLQDYIDDKNYSAEMTYEEVIPLVSEAITNGDIVYNEKTKGFFEALRDKISNVFKSNKKQPLNIEFNTGLDVFNFLKDYNDTINSGNKLNEAQLKIAKEGAKGKLVDGIVEKVDGRTKGARETKSIDNQLAKVESETKDIIAKESKLESNIKASENVQTIYETKGKDGAFEIIEQFKPIVSKIVEKRSEAPNFDRQLLTDEIETGKRGIIDLIKEYKPESGVPLAAYINKFLPARAIEASQRVLGEEFTTDVTEAKGVMAEEITTEVTPKPVKRKIKPSSLISNNAVGKIKEQVQEKIEGIDPKNLTFKKLGDLAPEIIAEEIGIPVKKLTVPAANLSKGDATAIQQFVNKNADKLLKILPQGAVVEAATEKLLGTSTGVPKGLLDAFYTKKARLGKGAGLAPFVLNKGITKAQFLEAFGIVDGKKQEGFNARSSQAQALKGIANLYGKLVTNEIVRSDTDLSLETKQDVAAGKNASMASKLESYDSMPPKLKTSFKAVSVLKNKKQLAADLDFKSPPINESNRKAQQTAMQKAVVEYGLDITTIEAGKMGSGGKQTFYGVKGGKMYSSAKQAFEGGIKKPIKFGKTKDGKFVEITTKGITNWVAKPGRLYYGKSDPAYKKLIKSANSYNGPKAMRVSPIQAFSKNKKVRELAAQRAKDNMVVLDHVVNQLTDAVAGGMSLDIGAAIIIQSYQATTGLVKISAQFKYRSIEMRYGGINSKKQQREGKKYREEHNPPASVVGASILLAIKNNAAIPTMEAIKENYYQTQLSKFDDDLLDQAKLDSTLAEGQSIFNNPITRLAAAGIDLNTLKNPDTGKTIAEESGFGIDPKIYDGYNANEKVQASNIQNEAILRTIENSDYNAAKVIKSALPLVEGKSMASKLDSDLIPNDIKYNNPITVQKAVNALEKTDKALNNARKLNAPVKKIRVFDFDDTLAKSKSMVIVNMPDGSTNQINATQFAQQASNLESQGAEFDFTQFSKVVEGKKGPLFEVAQKIADARGTEDVFILTARPQNADGPIKAFMEANGINIPLKNITGLGDGTAEAKAGWIMGKAAEGYNDFYFADDAIKNVQAVKNVLSQIDVKSKVQLAKESKLETFDTIVNDMIEDSSGIETYKQYSAARAQTVGASKGRFNFFIPASAEDFTGLLYKMLGKGKKGDAQMAFLKTNLLDPYDRAESAVTQAKIAAANDFKALKQNLKTLPKSLSKPTGIGGFTFSHAVRVAVWSKQGMDIPGLSKKDIKELNDFVDNNAELSVFTDELMKIQKGKPYPKPGKSWLGGNITGDIINDINKVNRAEYQQEWRENINIIFSEDNLNKMEAAYGTRWRNALEDSIRRMKSGSNRPPGGNSVTDGILDWLNNSVGAVMFLNTRSALLQTISAVNFINWGDNNIVKAGAAFANQKQFWGDFMTLMNSDYLVERRNGLKINVSESEIADAVRDSNNKVKSAIAFLLSKGFVMTRFADSFAIATGGSTFYRNRVKALVAKGMEQKAAEAQAFEDFRQIAEESQQSSNPNRISQQQASGAGRVILAWANTPMQYARIQKRAAQDIANGRGDWKTNVSKIVYYGAVQNLIFNALQQAVFALGFGEDEDEEQQDAKKSEKISRIANGMIDSQLKGLGIGGAAVVAIKSALMELGKQHAKNRPAYEEAVFDLLGFSPPLGSKIQKINGGLRSFSWNMKDIKNKGLSLDNPAYLAGAQITTGLTNIPLDRVIKKLNSMRGIVSEQSSLWQKVALGLGWSTWDVGLGYYGGFDAAKVLTPEEEKVKEIDDMKKLTKTKEQVDMLLDLGLSKKEIKALGKEQVRVEKIIELQNAEANPKEEVKVKEEIKEETKPTPKVKAKPKNESAERRLRRQFDSIKDENKPDQVKTLLKYGLTKKQIRALQYEKNRVNKILELMPKNK